MKVSSTKQRFIKPVLNLMPIALAIWNRQRSRCILNDAAKRITGFTERELNGSQSNWLARVHPDDRSAVLSAWKRVEKEKSYITCDYNFLPNGQKSMVRLRDNSVCFRNAQGRVEAIISSFTDISDLQTEGTKPQELEPPGSHESLIRPLVHELRNGLHLIRMGVDFMSLESEQSMASQAVANGIERLDELTKELRDYFVAPEPQLAVAEPDILLTQVVHEIEAELKRREVHLHVLYSSPLPHVRLDRAQIRDAFKRVMDFCQALLSNGGELEINAGRKTIDGQEWIELTLTSKTASTLEIDETNVFKPFLQVNGIQVGLSMAIAREILRRHHGQIVFRKESPRRGRIAILMKVSSAQRHKSRVTNMADIGGRFGITEQSEQQR